MNSSSKFDRKTRFLSENTIDKIDCSKMKKIYCACGSIVDLDGEYLTRRLKLSKEVECVHCRNLRISREIDELNAIFSTEEIVEPFFC